MRRVVVRATYFPVQRSSTGWAHTLLITGDHAVVLSSEVQGSRAIAHGRKFGFHAKAPVRLSSFVLEVVQVKHLTTEIYDCKALHAVAQSCFKLSRFFGSVIRLDHKSARMQSKDHRINILVITWARISEPRRGRRLGLRVWARWVDKVCSAVGFRPGAFK